MLAEFQEDSRRWRTLGFVPLATGYSLTVWFSTNAIAPALEVERGYSKTDIAWLTIVVQF